MRVTLWPEKNSWFRRNTSLVLCLLTMLLLTLGINEQGATIAQQRSLIRVLQQDSQELTAMKARDVAEAQRKKNAQPAPEAKAAPDKKSDEKQEAQVAPKQQRPPKAEAVIDVREVRRTLLRG
jgi:peptidoglycan hydrolase CwlO-like protein